MKSKPMWRNPAAAVGLALVIGAAAYLSMRDVAAAGAPDSVTFTCEVTGSDKAGFDIYAKNPGPETRKCKATCQLTRTAGGTISFTEENSVYKTDRAWFGGKSALKEGPFEAAKITNSRCD